MLVLTRKTGQRLVINDNIEITILEVKGDSVRVGVNAPKEITIYRQEIYEEIKRENINTVSTSSFDDISSLEGIFSSLPVKNTHNKVIINKPHNRNDK